MDIQQDNFFSRPLLQVLRGTNKETNKLCDKKP